MAEALIPAPLLNTKNSQSSQTLSDTRNLPSPYTDIPDIPLSRSTGSPALTTSLCERDVRQSGGRSTIMPQRGPHIYGLPAKIAYHTRSSLSRPCLTVERLLIGFLCCLSTNATKLVHFVAFALSIALNSLIVWPKRTPALSPPLPSAATGLCSVATK